ncbi:MAG: TonB-dependent receptor [Lentimicrobium sp.]
MKTQISCLFTLFMLAFGVQALSQTVIHGKILDFDTYQPLSGVDITVETTTEGTISNSKGEFTLITKLGRGKLIISHLGYQKEMVDFEATQETIIQLQEIFLKHSVINLSPIDILAFKASEQTDPVTVNSINRKMIQQISGDHSYPEIMRLIPGVYSSRTGGGVGDAAINIRGFKQENLALTLNGIPIGSVENGLVYWSNWDGLQEATENIQVQKGIGASVLVNNSLGGTINIITSGDQSASGGMFSTSTTDYGLQRTSFKYSTGVNANGLSISFMGSHTTGQGYVDGTQVNGFAYYLAISKRINLSHLFTFNAIGSPERHGQRSTLLSFAEIEEKGIKYNKDWGTYGGVQKNLAENFYHKPLLSFNHYWTINSKASLSTSVYFSYGKGGGNWAENFSGNNVFNYQTPAGQIDWDAIAKDNLTHQDIYITPEGDTLRHFAKNTQTLFLASHFWAGLISAYSYKLSDQILLTAGIHARYFKSWLWEEIYDLLGAQYFIDDYAWAIEGRQGRNLLKTKGDTVRIDNGAIVGLASTFVRANYEQGNLSGLLSFGLNYNTYQREDRYNYPTHPASSVVNKTGYELKAGIAYAINKNLRAYFNGGYTSRVPYYKFVFPNFNNNPAQNLKNEKITSAETGLRWQKNNFRLNLVGYYVAWQDKSLLSNEYKLINNQTTTRSLVTGLDALHKGIEAEANYALLNSNVNLSAFVSIGNWKWQNNVDAKIFNNENQLIDSVKVYAEGLYVGDAPQFQIGASVLMHFLKQFDFHVSYIWNDRFYADFDPALRTKPEDAQSWRIPGYGITDTRLGFHFEMMGMEAVLALACNNLLDIEYITRGNDGIAHDKETFRGYWGPGRTFKLSFLIQF